MSTRLPQMVVDLDAVDHNLGVMADWCSAVGVELYPHVKTTMAPRIVERQRAAGATGVTVATVDQVEVVVEHGQRDVLVANEVVDADGLARLAALRRRFPDLVLRVLVDSETGVDAIGRHASGLEVLLDVGAAGGRTGVRDLGAVHSLARYVARAPAVRLVGVAAYEGVVAGGREPETLARVDQHCAFARDAFAAVLDLVDTDAPIYSMGGSAYPDRVVRFLPDPVGGTRRILRSGCYVTHDHGFYAEVSGIPELTPAITVDAAVLSRPEPGTAVVGAGRRDLPSDAGLPVVVSVRRADGTALTAPAAEVVRLYDHHAVLATDVLEVADVVSFGISHPCSVFDRWSDFAVTRGGVRDPEHWRTAFARR